MDYTNWANILKSLSLLIMNGCYVFKVMEENKNYLNEFDSIRLEKVIVFI
jgi:hypothetical protein